MEVRSPLSGIKLEVKQNIWKCDRATLFLNPSLAIWMKSLQDYTVVIRPDDNGTYIDYLSGT